MRQTFAARSARRRARRLRIVALVAPLALLPALASAAPSPSNKVKGKGGNVGLGGTVGSQFGASLKWFAAPAHAAQFSATWGIVHHGSFRMDASYLFHPATLVSNSVMDLVPYFGVGLGFAVWGHGHFGVGHGGHRDRHGGAHTGILMRIPAAGLAFHWQKIPLDTVIEAAWSPMIEFAHGGAGFGAGHGDFFIGARYYF